MEVDKKIILMLVLFCQIMSMSYAAPSDSNIKVYQIVDISETFYPPTSTENFKTEGDTVSIFTNYISTGYGALKIHNTEVSWNDARNICLDENAQLSIIDSAAKEAMLLKQMQKINKSRAWLGIHNLFGKRQWTTIKGEKLSTRGYVHWGTRQPNNRGNEHCVDLRHDGMHDESCGTLSVFVCEKEES